MPAPKDPIKRAQWIEKIRAAHTGKSHSEEHRAKIGASLKGQFHYNIDITREIIKFKKGVLIAGPCWWKSFNDLCKEGSHLYDLEFNIVKERIFTIIRSKNLTQRDIVIFINWVDGHNFMEIAEHYYVTPEEVIEVVRKMEKIYPGVTQSERALRGSMLEFDILYAWQYKITAEF